MSEHEVLENFAKDLAGFSIVGKEEIKQDIELFLSVFMSAARSLASIAESLKVIAGKFKGDVDPDLEYVRKTIDKL